MRILLVLLVLWPPVLRAQALLAGSEYYDSFQTLASVVIMKAAGNEAGRDYLISTGQILPKNESSLPIILIARGTEPGSGAEFRFPNFPRTYWTFSENIATLEELHADAAPTPSPTPSATPSATPAATVAPTPTPEPTATATPKKKKHSKEHSSEHGAIQWHRVDGQWKWQPLDRSQFKGWHAGDRAPDGSHGP